VFKYNGVIKHAKRQSNTKKSFLYARNINRVKFGVQIHSNTKNLWMTMVIWSRQIYRAV